MFHSPRLATFARCLSRDQRDAAGRRRRVLLGTILEEKARSGAFDLELLHHWLDDALKQRAERALFGLGAVTGGIRAPAARRAFGAAHRIRSGR